MTQQATTKKEERIGQRRAPLSEVPGAISVRLVPTDPTATWVAVPGQSGKIWPVLLILSAGVAGLLYGSGAILPVRIPVLLWFLFFCPGLAAVHFLSIRDSVTRWTLAVGLSFSIEALVSAVLLYSGHWSPVAILTILIVLTIIGAAAQVAVPLLYKKYL